MDVEGVVEVVPRIRGAMCCVIEKTSSGSKVAARAKGTGKRVASLH